VDGCPNSLSTPAQASGAADKCRVVSGGPQGTAAAAAVSAGCAPLMVRLVFASCRRPLSGYARALEEAGLLIEVVREPVASRPDGTAHPLPRHL
jgi:hypothetical protein